MIDHLKWTFGEDYLIAFAGNLTYRGISPYFVLLLSPLGLFGAPDLLTYLSRKSRSHAPASSSEVCVRRLLAIVQGRAQRTHTAGAIIAILRALCNSWGVLLGDGALNAVHEVEETRLGSRGELVP